MCPTESVCQPGGERNEQHLMSVVDESVPRPVQRPHRGHEAQPRFGYGLKHVAGTLAHGDTTTRPRVVAVGEVLCEFPPAWNIDPESIQTATLLRVFEVLKRHARVEGTVVGYQLDITRLKPEPIRVVVPKRDRSQAIQCRPL